MSALVAILTILRDQLFVRSSMTQRAFRNLAMLGMAHGTINILVAAWIFIEYGLYVKVAFFAMTNGIGFCEIEYSWCMDVYMACCAISLCLTMAQAVAYLAFWYKSMGYVAHIAAYLMSCTVCADVGILFCMAITADLSTHTSIVADMA